MDPRLSSSGERRALDILCFGEALVEFTRVSGPGEPPLFAQGFGGDTSNTAIAAARQGARVGFMGAVGRDAFGDALLALWQQESVDTTAVVRSERGSTGVYFVEPHPSERIFTYYRKASAASCVAPDDIEVSVVRRAKILHTSAISQAISACACDAVFRALEFARSSDTLISYDSNLRLGLWPLERARDMTHSAMALSDIVFPSLDDSRVLTNRDDGDAIVDFYLELGVEIVLLKMGSRGVLAATGEKRVALPPLPVAVVDATGAGDVFNGAFLAAFVGGTDVFDAAAYANHAAALSTTGFGALSGVPTRQQVEETLR